MHDIIVVSDLHLGRGKNPQTGRYYRLEAFFYDDDFERFCRWLCDDAAKRKLGLVLVLNGDTFDLLRIDPKPGPEASAAERRYGPLMNPAQAAETMADILAGHPRFVSGLAHILSHGHQIVILPGNHDPEIQWAPVQAVVRDVLLAAIRSGDPGRATRAAERLRFEPWFYYEPGRIWIEHGCQYDPENSSRYPLRSALGDDDDAVSTAIADLPMGSFFQRYLYNGFGNLTFIVPNSRSNSRYFRWLLFNKPRLLARVTISHAPFFWQILRRLARTKSNLSELEQSHVRERDRLAQASGLGDTLTAVDDLKRVRGSAAVVTQRLLYQTVRVGLTAVMLTLFGAGMWFAGFFAINQMGSGVGLKTLTFLALNLLFLVTTVVGLGYLVLRSQSDSASRPLRQVAGQISTLIDAPIVTFGHSHEEEIQRLDIPDQSGESGDASDAGDSCAEPPAQWYFNTGTWIAVFTYGELIPRERVQYTFLRVRGASGELLHWSPGRVEPIPVVLFEEDQRNTPRQDP